MFRKIPALAALSLLFIFPAHAAPTVGKPAPDFKALDIYGKEQSVSQYKGQIVVLEWTNPECPFVKKHYDSGNMQKLQAYAQDKDAVWLKINSTASGKPGNLSAEDAKKSLTASKSTPSAYILDPEGTVGHLYGATATPNMFVIDAKGTLVYSGAIDNNPTASAAPSKKDRNYVKEAIDAASKGKKVQVASTKPYGCGVKYAN